MKILEWVRKLGLIVKYYDKDRLVLLKQIEAAEKVIRDRTEIHVDLSSGRDPNQVIIVGRYRNRDYVQIFSVSEGDLAGFVGQLQKMREFGTVSRVDAAANLDVSFLRESML